MIRILHAADLHLDSPFEGLPEAQAAERRRGQRALLGRMAALCEERAVSLVLLAGDLFDSDAAYPDTVETLSRALAAIGAPVFIAPGNHDFCGRSSGWRTGLPANVHVFTRPEITCAELPELRVRVWGAGFADRTCPGLLSGFAAPEKRPGVIDLMCIHGEVGNPASPYNPISEAEIAASGMDYIALGHVHAFSGLRKAGSTFYAWPGCAEGRGFDETGEKGVVVADVDAGETALRFVPLGGRRYEMLSVDVSEAEDVPGAVLARLPAGAERDTYRIVLTGGRDAAPDIPALRRALEGQVFGLQVRDETRLRRDVWARAGEDSLRGVFLRMLREKLEAAQTDTEREQIARAARWGIAALDNGEEPESL